MLEFQSLGKITTPYAVQSLGKVTTAYEKQQHNHQHIWHLQQGCSKPLCVVQAPLVIHTPHALPMFKEAKQIRKRKSERDHDDAVKYHKPEVGSSAATLGRGAAGLIGKTGGTLLTQYILKNHVSPLTLLGCVM